MIQAVGDERIRIAIKQASIGDEASLDWLSNEAKRRSGAPEPPTWLREVVRSLRAALRNLDPEDRIEAARLRYLKAKAEYYRFVAFRAMDPDEQARDAIGDAFDAVEKLMKTKPAPKKRPTPKKRPKRGSQ